MCRNGVDGRDFLNLTVDEMMHIRQVLTKAELDNMTLAKDLHTDIKLEIICFLCKTTRFNLFKKKFKCKFCEKCVCKSCCRSIQLPQNNLLKVPITILSPSASSRFMDMRSESSNVSNTKENKNASSISSDALTNDNNRPTSQSNCNSKPPTTADVNSQRRRSQVGSKAQSIPPRVPSHNKSFDLASSANDLDDCLVNYSSPTCCLPTSTSKWLVRDVHAHSCLMQSKNICCETFLCTSSFVSLLLNASSFSVSVKFWYLYSGLLLFDLGKFIQHRTKMRLL